MKYKYIITPLEHGLATEFPSIHIPGTWSPSMQNIKIEQHSLKKRWGYDTADRSLGSSRTVYVIAVYQLSTGTRYTLYLTDQDLLAKETATDYTWSYKTRTMTTGKVTDITGAVVTGSAACLWKAAETAGTIAAGDSFILSDDQSPYVEPDAEWAEIASIDSETQITLTASYGGTTGAMNADYKIRHVYSVPANERWTWAVVGDKFCFANGNENVQYWGGTGYAANLNASVAVKARYCMEYANRLFIADYGATRDPYGFAWSKENDPTNWSDSTYGEADLLETEDFITGLGKSGGDLLVFKRDNIYIFSQSGSATAPIATSPTNRIRGIGCVAPYSIVEVLGTSAFLGRDDFYIIDSGTPQAIGKDLSRYDFFNQVTETELENVWGWSNTVANEIVWMANTSSGLLGWVWNYISKEWSIYKFGAATITAAGRGAI